MAPLSRPRDRRNPRGSRPSSSCAASAGPSTPLSRIACQRRREVALGQPAAVFMGDQRMVEIGRLGQAEQQSAAAAGSAWRAADPRRGRPGSRPKRRRRPRRRDDRRKARPCGRGWRRRSLVAAALKAGAVLLGPAGQAGAAPAPWPHPAASNAASSRAAPDRRAGRGRCRDSCCRHRHAARSATGRCRRGCRSRDRPGPRPSAAPALRRKARSARDWTIGSPSMVEAEPVKILENAVDEFRAGSGPGSRSSIRSRNFPPLARAWAWPSAAEKAWPRCSRPDGEGAKRVTFRTHSMIKATAATLDGDSPLVVSCHRHPGLASGVADGKTGFGRRSPAKVPPPGKRRDSATRPEARRSKAHGVKRTLENIAPCIIPTSFAIRTAAPRWCSTPTIRR